MGRWTRRAYELQTQGNDVPDKTDNIRPVERAASAASAMPEHFEREVAWRMAAFRARIPAHGPIWPPRLCDTALCDTPGRCSLCGDELVGDPAPRFRCLPCVRALWLALNTSREGVAEAEGGDAA